MHAAFVTAATSMLGTNGIGPLWPSNVQCTSLVTDMLDAAGRNTTQDSTAVSLAGTGTGQCLPQRVCLVVSLRTAQATRAGRGRFYLPAPDATHLTTSGEFATADAISMADQFASALSTMATTSSPVVYHRGKDAGTVISRVEIGAVFGTQRRRTNKVANTYQASDL